VSWTCPVCLPLREERHNSCANVSADSFAARFNVVCLKKKFMFTVMTLIVLVVMAYAIAKGVKLFKGDKENEDGEDGGPSKSPLLASQT